MSQHLFTKEEQELLAANQYTFKVSDKQLSFTAEFKALFWDDYCTGNTPAQILRKYGYPTEVLGESRITGIQRLIKKESQKADGFFSGRRPPAETSDGESPDVVSQQKRINKLEQKMQYLEQQMEFLKKFHRPELQGSRCISYE